MPLIKSIFIVPLFLIAFQPAWGNDCDPLLKKIESTLNIDVNADLNKAKKAIFGNQPGTLPNAQVPQKPQSDPGLNPTDVNADFNKAKKAIFGN